jgi:hypothetical protein
VTFIRRTSINRAASIKPDTVAFIHDDRKSPDYPKGMTRFWHTFSLQKGHVSAARGYSVRDACAVYSIDPDELLARLDRQRREHWAKLEPGARDASGHCIT